MGKRVTAGVRLFSIFSIGVFVLSVTKAEAFLDLDASVGVSETYTDNLFFSPGGSQDEDDFGTFITSKVGLTYGSKDIVLSGAYVGTGQIFANNPEANAYTQGANVGIDLPFLARRYKNLEVKINESFNITPTLPAFTANNASNELAGGVPGSQGIAGGGIGGIGGLAGNAVSNQGIFTGRSTTQIQNDAGVDVTYGVSPRLSFFASYQNGFSSFTDSSLQGSLTHSVRGGMGFDVSPRTSLNVFYGFQLVDFENTGSPTAQSPGSGGTATSHSAGIGGSYQVSPTMAFIGSGSVAVTETETGSSRVNFNTDLGTTKVLQLGQISFSYDQSIGTGGGLAASSTLNQTLTASVSRPLTRKVSGFVQVGVAQNKSLSGEAIDTKSLQASGGVTATFLSWLNGFVAYSYITQDSTGTFGSTAQSNQVIVGLSAGAPSWRFFK